MPHWEEKHKRDSTKLHNGSRKTRGVITVKMWGVGGGGNGTFGKTKDLLKQPPQYHLP